MSLSHKPALLVLSLAPRPSWSRLQGLLSLVALLCRGPCSANRGSQKGFEAFLPCSLWEQYSPGTWWPESIASDSDFLSHLRPTEVYPGFNRGSMAIS